MMYRRWALILTAAILLVSCALLAWPRAVPAPADGFEPDEVTAGLDRPVDELRLDAVPMQVALDLLSRKSGARIEPDWSSLGTADVTRQSPVTLRAYRTNLAGALEALLAAARTRWGGLSYYADGGSVIVTRERDLPVFTRVYDVRDVLDDLDASNCRAQPAGVYKDLDPVSFSDGSRAPETYTWPPPREEGAQQLLDLVGALAVPDGWGGREIQMWSERLVVVQTPPGHKEVARLLRKLRDQGGRWVPPPRRGRNDR